MIVGFILLIGVLRLLQQLRVCTLKGSQPKPQFSLSFLCFDMKMGTRSALLFFFPSHSRLQNIPLTLTISFLRLFSSPAKTTNSNSKSNSALVDCLTDTYKFTKIQALSISNRFSSVKSPGKPRSVHKFLQELGFSETQMWSTVHGCPRILFCDVNKTLRPKVEFFQQLGFENSDLGRLVARSPRVLTRSLQKKLLPCIQILRKIYGCDENDKDFIRVFGKYRWDLFAYPQRLLANCAILEAYGIVGPHLCFILKTKPDIFFRQESKLRDLLLRISDMGFSQGSRMFVRGVVSVSGLSIDTLKKKLELVCSFGFSEDECMEMFRRQPMVFGCSKETLKFKIDFFLNEVGFKKSLLIHSPKLLGFSTKKRVIPRYKVLQVLKLKKLFKKEPSLYTMLVCREDQFLEKFILKFKDEAEELLVVYKGNISDSSDEEES